MLNLKKVKLQSVNLRFQKLWKYYSFETFKFLTLTFPNDF